MLLETDVVQDILLSLEVGDLVCLHPVSRSLLISVYRRHIRNCVGELPEFKPSKNKSLKKRLDLYVQYEQKAISIVNAQANLLKFASNLFLMISSGMCSSVLREEEGVKRRRILSHYDSETLKWRENVINEVLKTLEVLNSGYGPEGDVVNEKKRITKQMSKIITFLPRDVTRNLRLYRRTLNDMLVTRNQAMDLMRATADELRNNVKLYAFTVSTAYCV